MLESFEDLSSGLEVLSNHFRKALHIVKKNSLVLRQRLEVKGMTGKVHLWRKAHNYRREMKYIISVSHDTTEMKSFLGTFFVHQLLQLHFLNIDTLRRDVNDANRLEVYRNVLTRFRFQMKNLISNYLRCLMEIVAENISFQGIAICNVGMIMDQDDIDVAVFVDPSIDIKFWNRIISQISNEFLRHSTKMHFYIAENVANRTFLVTAEDIERHLTKDIHNFILISELLLAEFLLGDEQVLARIENKVIRKFYYHKERSLYHEAYLRGMMNEVQESLRIDLTAEIRSPKKDALRLIHNLMSMLKTISGVQEHGSRDIMDILQQIDGENADYYRDLSDIFNFMEMFFYTYQLLVTVDDTFDITDKNTLDNLDRVAVLMGFEGLGIVRPAMRLLTHYYEKIDHLQRIGTHLMSLVNSHLKQITIFNPIMWESIPPDYPLEVTDNKAINVLNMFKLFRGINYWDDILELLGQNNGEFLKEILRHIEKLEEKKHLRIFKKFLQLLLYDMDSMVITGVLFAENIRHPRLRKYFDVMKEWLNQQLKNKPDRLIAFLDLLRTHPAQLTSYLISLNLEQLLELRQIVRERTFSTEKEKFLKERFIGLCELLAFSSNNYRRLFSRVAKLHSDIVTHVTDIPYLDKVLMRLWAELTDATSPAVLKQKLSEYYEFGFCRCGLEAIYQPGNLESLYDNYHAFFRRYFKWLFRACQWDIENKGYSEHLYRERDDEDQPLAVFCTGGYAREEAFENDIDLFVLSFETDPAFLKYASRIVNNMNRELSKRGVIPHHRFAEFLNSFVIPLQSLEDFLKDAREEDFIEFSQLLGSQLLVGNRELDAAIDRLLEKYLFSNPRRFIRKMFEEIDDRKAQAKSRKDRSFMRVSVKEDPGALRDIQLIVAICQTYIRSRQPVIWRAFQELKIKIPELVKEFNILKRSYRFMRYFKDIYTLSLAGADEIMKDRLVVTAHRMGLQEGEMVRPEGSAPKLINSYRYHRNRALQAIAEIKVFFEKNGYLEKERT